MIRAIIFDFDGVIIESTEIKTDAFAALFREYPEHLDAIVAHHVNNMGISRYEKFRHIFRNILHEPLSCSRELELGERFSQLVFQRILSAPFVKGAREFLASAKGRFRLFIASGTPEEELYQVVQAREILGCFAEIHGSPEEKVDIVNGILQRHDLQSAEVVFVGDATTDRVAAEKTGVFFVARITGENKESLGGCRYVVDDLSALPAVLDGLPDSVR